MDIQKNNISLDYIKSNDLEKIEYGILNTQEGIRLSKLTICIAIFRISSEKLYTQAGFNTEKEYLESNRLFMPKSTYSEYKKAGMIYMKYRDKLEKAGYDGGYKNLLLLEKALDSGMKVESVFSNIRLPYRTFKMSIDNKINPYQIKSTKQYKKIQMIDSSIRNLIDAEVDERNKSEIKIIIKQIEKKLKELKSKYK